jgi:DNA-binding transcriptional ArsR family regulator
MVEYTLSLDSVFASLSDPTRRDILKRVGDEELSVSQIAQPYDMSLAAISKHLKILERARLIIKKRQGKEQIVSLAPQTLSEASDYLENYRKFWESRYEALEDLLNKEE